MPHSVEFLVDICDDMYYRSKSGNTARLDRQEILSHRWRERGPFLDEWNRKFKCRCGAMMGIRMGRIESDEEDMQITIQKKRGCLSEDEWDVKDIVE